MGKITDSLLSGTRKAYRTNYRFKRRWRTNFAYATSKSQSYSYTKTAIGQRPIQFRITFYTRLQNIGRKRNGLKSPFNHKILLL